jgi:hypothetical protein
MNTLYNNYGYVILKKGSFIYHNSDYLFENIKDNSFFTFDKKGWKGKYTYKYKLIQDLKILLTITNNTIKDNKLILFNNYRSDQQILTKLYNDYIEQNKYNDDVNLKQSDDFNVLCNKLYENNYNGLFNYIDAKTIFEVVIFKPIQFIKLINIKENVEDDTYKKIFNLLVDKSKINFICPFNIELADKYNKTNYYVDHSIFYYIYCHNNQFL